MEGSGRVAAEALVLIVLLAVYIVTALAFKWPLGGAMLTAAVAGALVCGQGLALRHVVEGAFSYLDTVLVIATAMIFMRVLAENGALDRIGHQIVVRFARFPATLLVLAMLFIMFPGMVTGSSTASVLTTGAIM